MNTKNTPGPWHSECGNVWRENGLDMDQSNLATAHGPSAEANARLIAAAPELLEAVQAFQEWLHAETMDFQSVSFDKRMEMCAVAQIKADAAITKATGTNI